MVAPAIALLAATVCQPDTPRVDPWLLVQIARKEAPCGRDCIETATVHVNSNRTRDFGATGINSANLDWLGVTAADLLDESTIMVRGVEVQRGLCLAMKSSGRFLTNLSRYNTGSPTSPVGLTYARAVTGTAPQVIPSVHAPQPQGPPVAAVFWHPVLLQQH